MNLFVEELSEVLASKCLLRSQTDKPISNEVKLQHAQRLVSRQSRMLQRAQSVSLRANEWRCILRDPQAKEEQTVDVVAAAIRLFIQFSAMQVILRLLLLFYKPTNGMFHRYYRVSF